MVLTVTRNLFQEIPGPAPQTESNKCWLRSAGGQLTKHLLAEKNPLGLESVVGHKERGPEWGEAQLEEAASAQSLSGGHSQPKKTFTQALPGRPLSTTAKAWDREISSQQR